MTPLGSFVRAAPLPQRAGLRVLIALGHRPRGVRLLHRLAPADQLANGLLVAERFEDPVVTAALGWSADAVAERGRALRRAEGRP